MRRTVAMTITGALALCLMAAPAQAAPAPAYVMYHAVTPAQHEAKVKELTGKGYRPISLSVTYGPRYAAVWVKRKGPAFEVVNASTPLAFKLRNDEFRERGWQPTLFTAAGDYKGTIFAGVFEQRSGPSKIFWKTGEAGIRSEGELAAKQGLVMTSLSAYGSYDNVTYGAVWSKPTSRVAAEETYGLTDSEQRAAIVSYRKKGYRPTVVAIAPDGTYATSWNKNPKTTGTWQEFHGLTRTGFTGAHRRMTTLGYIPIQVDSKRKGYTAVFTKPTPPRD